MRNGIILAAALIALSMGTARAEQWCGYAGHKDAVIECGYTSESDCESAVNKTGVCFIDPDYALNGKSPTQSRLGLFQPTSTLVVLKN